MRALAITFLLSLASVTASALSPLHFDHEGSHKEDCPLGTTGAHCHAETPHEHEGTHGGEESLFEHIFESSLSQNITPPCVNAVFCASYALPPVVSERYDFLSQKIVPFHYQRYHRILASRAPPLPHS